MGPVVLDTSVLIALFDPLDPLHAAAADAIHDARGDRPRFVVPASVLAELLVGAARSGTTEDVRRRTIDAFGPIRALDEDIAVAAALRRSTHPSLRLPDALVLATADVEQAARVLTGDRRWRDLDPRVRIIA